MIRLLLLCYNLKLFCDVLYHLIESVKSDCHFCISKVKSMNYDNILGFQCSKFRIVKVLFIHGENQNNYVVLNMNNFHDLFKQF